MAAKNVTNMIDSWKKLNIKTIQNDLDEKVIEIAQQLEEGDQSRKRLIEQTKEFRKSLTDDQRKLVGPMLKSFQVEVDSTTKRIKSMEQVLLKLYKQLIELPDPEPILDSAQRLLKRSEKAQDLEIENKQLRETLDAYNTEFADVKNQEVTIKLLNNKIKELEEKSEQIAQQKTREREKELQRLFDDKMESMQHSQLELAKKLGDTELRNQTLVSQLQKSQNDLFELKTKQDELLSGKSCETEMLQQDLDKMTERAVNAERLVEQYAEQKSLIAESADHLAREEQQQQQQLQQANEFNYRTSTLELELAAKEREISQLVDDLQRLQAKQTQSRKIHEQERASLEERLNERERIIEQYEHDMKAKSDYDEIKRELGILKSIEFASVSGNDETNTDEGSTSTASAKPIETLLLEKNRQLMSDNTLTKNRLSELCEELDEIKSENVRLKRLSDERRLLIEQLEKDLLNSASGRLNQVDLKSSENRADASSLLMEPVLPSSNVANDDTSLLSIVSNQRERFRQRVQELETENMTSKQQTLVLTNQVDQLRSDNVKLYEKIKFLQSPYNTSKANYRPSSTSMPEHPDYAYESNSAHMKSMKQKNSHEDLSLFNRYTNEYEQKLDPFSNFNKRERQRRYENLNMHDKFTLSFGRFILSSRLARLIFFAYFFIIHLLIFVSLYGMAHREASHRDLSAECAKSFSEHMASVHGQKLPNSLSH